MYQWKKVDTFMVSYYIYGRHRCEQKPGEKVGSYVVALKELAATCEFGSFLNEALRDRLVRGLRSEAVQRSLLSEKDLTWKTGQEIAQAMKMANQENRSFGQGTTGSVKQATPPGGDGKVHAVSKSGSYHGNRGYKSDQQKRHCFRCRDSRHMADDCRFNDAICRKCGKKGTLRAQMSWEGAQNSHKGYTYG